MLTETWWKKVSIQRKSKDILKQIALFLLVFKNILLFQISFSLTAILREKYMYTSHISLAQNTWSPQWYTYCTDVCILIHHYHLMSKVYTRIHSWGYIYVLCLTAQSCLTLCDPVDCSLPGSFVHGDSPGKNTRVGCHALLQGFLPTQGSNPGLSHCRQILYCVSHQGSPLDFLKKHLRFRNSPLLQQSFKVFRENRQF